MSRPLLDIRSIHYSRLVWKYCFVEAVLKVTRFQLWNFIFPNWFLYFERDICHVQSNNISPAHTKFKVKFGSGMTLWTYFTKRVDYKRQIWKITFKVGSIVPSYRLQLRNNLQPNTLPICTAAYLSYCIQLHVCSLFDSANITSGKFDAHQQINLAPKDYVQYFAVEFEQGMQKICNLF